MGQGAWGNFGIPSPLSPRTVSRHDDQRGTGSPPAASRAESLASSSAARIHPRSVPSHESSVAEPGVGGGASGLLEVEPLTPEVEPEGRPRFLE